MISDLGGERDEQEQESKHTEAQIIAVLKQLEAGQASGDFTWFSCAW
jgi:hypothetical protein